MKYIFTLFILSIYCLQTGYAAVVTINSTNKSTYFDNNSKWKNTNTTNFADGLSIEGIEAIFENVTLTFGPSAAFTIKSKNNIGAHIEMYGCVLSPMNGVVWKGVVLNGVSNKPQINTTNNSQYQTEQSRVFMLPYVNVGNGTNNRCLVEKAELGIEVNNGAMLRCTNSDFINCNQAVQFNAYDKKNLSLFKDCTFKWTNFMTSNRSVADWIVEDFDVDGDISFGYEGDNIVDRPKTMVGLNNVYGITFLGGNEFINEITLAEIESTLNLNDYSTACPCNSADIAVSSTCRGIGIYSVKSSFITLRGGPCYFPEDPNTTAYDPADGCVKCTGSQNQFYGLSFGVFAKDYNNKNSTVFLTGNLFENCATGIRTENAENHFINRNEFFLDGRGSILYGDFGYHAGIWLMNPGAYDVADNLFDYDVKNGVNGLVYSSTLCMSGMISVGLVVDNAGQSRGRSHRNTYNFMKISAGTNCGNPFVAELYNGSNEIIHITCNNYDVFSVNSGTSDDWRIANYKSFPAFTRKSNHSSYSGLHLPYSTKINNEIDIAPHLSTKISNQFMTHNDWYPLNQTNANNFSNITSTNASN
ncbi:MAG: hypothetical protein KDC92_07810, partial [Bacteroidetes bacterium]|nr:hypothetical protein [Bacteroidota bacterium]